VRPDTYSSCTWLVPPRLHAESRFSDQRLLVSGLSKAYTPAKAQQHRQNILQRLYGLKPGKPRPDASRKRCRAFCGFPTEFELQLNFPTYVPELNIRGRTRGLTEGIIHRDSGKTSRCFQLFCRKMQCLCVIGASVQIVHASGNKLCWTLIFLLAVVNFS
jgi:hypothetical protein